MQVTQGDTRLHFTFDKRTRTDSGISNGITPVAAANAITRPEPAGNEIPIGSGM